MKKQIKYYHFFLTGSYKLTENKKTTYYIRRKQKWQM